jgi:alpha-beta hydrolase superfamily lysophospholipase
VTGITSAVEIASGEDHTCVRLTDSTIKCWGRGDMGQLGNGKFSNSSVPVAVTGVSTATQIGLGLFHSCARLSNSTLKCWGNNGDAELGMGSSCFFGGCSNQATAVTVTGISNAVAVQPGQWHTCALLSTGGVKCWGNNTVGQLGNGNFTDNPTPSNVSGLSNVTALDAGAQHNCAVLGDSSVKCWGNNDSGQLGNNTTTNSNVPVVASGISTATQVAGGANHSCAALSNKTVMCWGRNDEGQVGDGTIDYTSVPKTAVGVTATSQLATGPYGYHNCIRRDDSTMMCWGDNGVSRIGDGHVPNFTTPIQPVCNSVEVERSDYFISITTANMPDSAFNGLAGQLDGHRVKPVFFPETCTAQQGMVLVHGRTVEAASAFDLQYQDYSFMEQLALAGVDTFAFNHLGMGRSSGFTAMSDACNAALPACLDIGQTCPPPVGVLCDCGPPPTFGVNDKNQQGSTRYLNPNPLTALCAHTTNTRFTNTTTMVADVDAAVDDALSKSGLSKVSLLGYSAGGIDVGNYLGTADNTARAAHTAKIDKAIFVSSLFGLPQVGATEPTGGSGAHSYPMGVMDRGSATAGGFNLDLVACPGQRDVNIVDPIWASVKARDSVGATWGPSQTPAENGGLSRFPHATRWGWDATSAARVTVPVLVMQGLRDNVVPVVSSANLYNALTGTASKTIVQIGCGSHSIFWEGCSGAQCNSWTGPHSTIKKNSQDWVQTGMIYASPGSANGSFGSTDSEGVNYHTDAPTEDGPAADEGNLLP